MKSAARYILKSIVEDLRDVLPGFRNRGADFRLVQGDLTWYFGIQDVKSTSSDVRRITAACGVYSREVTVVQCGREFRGSDKIKQPDCTIFIGLSELAHNTLNVPSSWTINPLWNTIHQEQVSRELRYLVVDFAMPFLRRFNGLRDLLTFLEDSHPSLGARAWPRGSDIISLECRGILHALLGNRTVALSLIDQAITRTRVDEARIRLGEVRKRVAVMNVGSSPRSTTG